MLASRTPLILGFDANACSPLLFSEMPERIFGLHILIRSEEQSEWCIARLVKLLNEPSEWFTFHNILGASDTDFTIANDAVFKFFLDFLCVGLITTM